MYFKTIRNVFQINFVVLSALVRTFPPVSCSSNSQNVFGKNTTDGSTVFETASQ